MNFIKTFFAAFLALVAFSIIAVILFFVVIGGIIGSLTTEKQVVLKENSVLHLKLDAQINELQQENPFEGLPIPGGDFEQIGLMQLKDAIAHAKNDNNIKGIVLDVSSPLAGFSTIEEVRQSLLDFRKSGKWVLAYNVVMSEGAYYLATAADKIYLNPEGQVEFNGLAIEISFFKRLFDKLQINPQVFRVGEFKSAVEPFLLEQMSKENELQLTELANSIYDQMLTRISEARNIPKEKLEEISDNMMIRNAKMAKEYGLIDGLFYQDEFENEVKQRLGIDEGAKISSVKYDKYRKSFSDYKSTQNEVAVIVAEGAIMPGDAEQPGEIISADKFVEEVRKARRDNDIKAIVIRINSPGGEFTASDMMWREIQLARKVKPVIASMSDYAASGGYYLAMGCDTIVAQPHTITGSIGIFGVMFDLSEFLGDKIGITFDEVKTGKYGEMFTVSRPLTEAERNYWQTSLNEHYETFTSKAAQGRDVPVDAILKVASGRVWTGAQALDRRLVDITGGFEDAVKIAATKAGIKDDYKVRYYPKQKNFLEQWMDDSEENIKADAIKSELGEYHTWYQQFQTLKTYQGAQARLPFELRIR